MQTELQTPAGPDRWTLIRDAAALQVKLVVDGLRDLVLVPASLIATLMSLIHGRDGRPGPHFYRLLAMGKRSERVIDLFGAYRNAPAEVSEGAGGSDVNIDDLVSRVESFVVDEYRRGGVTAQAKERLDKALDALQRKKRGQNEDGVM